MWWHRIAMGWFKTAWKQRQTISSCQVVKYCLVKRQALRWKDVYWTLQMVLRSQPKAISKQSFADGSKQLTTKWSGQHPNMRRLKLQVLQSFCNPSCTSHVRESCEGNWFSQASVMVLLDNSAKGFVARAVAYRIKLQTVKRWLSQQILRECPKKYVDLIETQGIGPSVINRMPEQGPRLSHVQVKKRQPSAVLDHHGAPVVTSRTQDENIEL